VRTNRRDGQSGQDSQVSPQVAREEGENDSNGFGSGLSLDV